MTPAVVQVETAAPGVGAVCGAWLVHEGQTTAGLVFFAASLAVYALGRRSAA